MDPSRMWSRLRPAGLVVVASVAVALVACSAPGAARDPLGQPGGQPIGPAPSSGPPVSITTEAEPTSDPPATSEPGASAAPVPYLPPAPNDRSDQALATTAQAFVAAVNAHDLRAATVLTCPSYAQRLQGFPPDFLAGNMFSYTQDWPEPLRWTLKQIHLRPDRAHATVDYEGHRGADDVWPEEFAYENGWCHAT